MKEYGVVWLSISTFSLVFMLGLGVRIGNRPLGVLVDSRCKMSLSRLQVLLWTWLVVSTFSTIAWVRGTMSIDVPEELWALMGISVGSTAGAVLIKGTKAGIEPDLRRVAAQASSSRRGVLQANADAKKARLADMFKGEEITDFAWVDISKVQLFFFTVAAWFGYVLALWNTPPGTDGVAFPELSTSIVTLIGISHVGYLTVKAAPKTPAA